MTATQIETLTRINLQDMLDNFGLSHLRHGRGLIERVFWSPAQILARQVAHLDHRVGEAGLQMAAQELLMQYVNRWDIVGAENIPSDGGVVFASNHPGMTDTLACFASIPRDDLRAVSQDRAFIRALPCIAERILFVSDAPSQRLTVVRRIVRFLQDGGAILITPAGRIEPDPTVMPGAIESLKNWSDSLGLFVRLAPDTVIVPLVVSGVVYGPSLKNPLTRLRTKKKDRERVAATIQAFLLSIGYLKPRMNVRVEFGKPLCANELIPLGNARAITRGITDAVKYVIERHDQNA